MDAFEVEEAEDLVLTPTPAADRIWTSRRRFRRTSGTVAWTTLILAVIFGLLSFFWKGGEDVVSQSPRIQDPLHEEAPSSSHEITVARQIQSFKRGDGILLNVQIEHQGGQTVCREMSSILEHPSVDCMYPRDDDVGDNYPAYWPWSNEETGNNIAIVREHFQMISWEFNRTTKPHLSQVDWENPGLVSLFVAREPLSRALAGDEVMQKKYPGIFFNKNATKEEWWQFAVEDFHNNNFALSKLSNPICCNGSKTERHYLEEAKRLIQRFTFVLDIACLEHGLEKVAEILGFHQLQHPRRPKDGRGHAVVEDRIPFQDVYDFLQEKNKLDIELHEFAKSIALLECDAVW